MTHGADILFCPVEPLKYLPRADRDVLLRVLTRDVQGITAADHDRWSRLVHDLLNAEAGETFAIRRIEDRDLAFHMKHRAVLQRIFEVQEAVPPYASVDALHDVIKLKTWFVDWIDGKPRPKSTSFAKCPEDDLRDLHNRMIALLRDPDFQQELFPSVPMAQRGAMVEALLTVPDRS